MVCSSERLDLVSGVVAGLPPREPSPASRTTSSSGLCSSSRGRRRWPAGGSRLLWRSHSEDKIRMRWGGGAGTAYLHPVRVGLAWRRLLGQLSGQPRLNCCTTSLWGTLPRSSPHSSQQRPGGKVLFFLRGTNSPEPRIICPHNVGPCLRETFPKVDGFLDLVLRGTQVRSLVVSALYMPLKGPSHERDYEYSCSRWGHRHSRRRPASAS